MRAGRLLPRPGGYRISDTVLITPSGPERLTHYPRDLESLTLSLGDGRSGDLGGATPPLRERYVSVFPRAKPSGGGMGVSPITFHYSLPLPRSGRGRGRVTVMPHSLYQRT